MTFEHNDGIWISDIHRDRIPQLCARYWDSFLSHCCSSIIYMNIRAVSSYSLWYLVSEVKVNLFRIWIFWNIQIFIHKGCLMANAIWRHHSRHTKEQQQLLSALRATVFLLSRRTLTQTSCTCTNDVCHKLKKISIFKTLGDSLLIRSQRDYAIPMESSLQPVVAAYRPGRSTI